MNVETLIEEEKTDLPLDMSKRVCSFLNRFHITYNQKNVKEKTITYSEWITTVDDYIDDHEGGIKIGRSIVNYLKNPNEQSKKNVEPALIGLTEHFKEQIPEESYDNIVTQLSNLFDAVTEERISSCILDYIEVRKSVGNFTGEVLYQLIEPHLEDSSKKKTKIRRSLKQLCETGCLFDSSLDIKSDMESGLVNFNPSKRDIVSLYFSTAKNMIKMFVMNWELLPEYADLIKKNLKYVYRPSSKIILPS